MKTWWQRGIIYQIYPRSFLDADADGVGDLRGIISRLDYPAALGVDAILTAERGRRGETGLIGRLLTAAS